MEVPSPNSHFPFSVSSPMKRLLKIKINLKKAKANQPKSKPKTQREREGKERQEETGRELKSFHASTRLLWAVFKRQRKSGVSFHVEALKPLSRGKQTLPHACPDGGARARHGFAGTQLQAGCVQSIWVAAGREQGQLHLPSSSHACLPRKQMELLLRKAELLPDSARLQAASSKAGAAENQNY